MSRHFASTALAVMVLLAGCSSVSLQHTTAWNRPGGTQVPVAASIDSDTSARFGLAIDHMQAGRWDDAIPILESLTESHDRLAGPWLNLGIAYTRSGNGDSARTAFEAATACNPQQAEAWNQLGMLHRRGGEHVQAAAMYRRAIDADPEHADTHWNLAVLHDLYLPDGNAAHHHLVRYQQLTGSEDPQLLRWMTELRERTTTGMTAGATGQ